MAARLLSQSPQDAPPELPQRGSHSHSFPKPRGSQEARRAENPLCKRSRLSLPPEQPSYDGAEELPRRAAAVVERGRQLAPAAAVDTLPDPGRRAIPAVDVDGDEDGL